MSRSLPSQSGVTRRRFGAIAGSAFASLALGSACSVGPEPEQTDEARLGARPKGSAPPSAPGTRPLGLGSMRDGLLQLPSKAPTAPVPMLLLLHGAGGSGANILRRLGTAADEAGIAVLAPDSRNSTWDAIRGRFGADVRFVNRALERAFESVAIDPARIAIGGFSDGATYALSLGLINGDLFRRVLAFSPGFIVSGIPNGKPRVFVSHGTGDPILPIDRCGRVIAGALQKSGYEVTYREFDGGHEMPAAIAAEGMRWVAARP